MKIPTEVSAVLKKYDRGIHLDIGCGNYKQRGFVGMDILPLPNVDIVWDLEKFPWPLPDESVSTVMASHILEHVNPSRPDPRFAPLIDLLINKNVLTKEEVEKHIGEYNIPTTTFIRLMNEVWRILKPDGQFMIANPYAGSGGYWQDPTHVNGITEVTWGYFDPLHKVAGNRLYSIYEPKPWKVDYSTWVQSQNLETLLIKRRDDRSYHLPK